MAGTHARGPCRTWRRLERASQRSRRSGSFPGGGAAAWASGVLHGEERSSRSSRRERRRSLFPPLAPHTDSAYSPDPFCPLCCVRTRVRGLRGGSGAAHERKRAPVFAAEVRTRSRGRVGDAAVRVTGGAGAQQQQRQRQADGHGGRRKAQQVGQALC